MKPRRIVVAGYIVGFPLGGMVWCMLHYLAGLARLGHEVIFLEDSSDWSFPYDPVARTWSADSSYARGLMDRLFARYGLAGRWAYYSQLEHKLYGMEPAELSRFLDQADVFLNISGIIPLRPEYLRAPLKVLVDTDPIFYQVKAATDPKTIPYVRAHDAFFTYGYLIPQGRTGAPLSGLDWKPILPPVLLDQWTPQPGPGNAWTTIGTWDVKERELEIEGKRYSWRKSKQFERVVDLPRQVPPGVRFELAFGDMKDDIPLFTSHGWTVSDGVAVSADVDGYRQFIRQSRGEFSAAKEMNAVLQSGWFSDRTACYLAAGRPAVIQDCGVGAFLPTGEGLFTYKDMDDILAAIRAVESDYPRHRAAAQAIAQEHFAAEKVLAGMLGQLGLD